MQIKDFRIDHNFKELTQHRTVELPIACYEIKISHHIQGVIPLHWHDEVQFVLIMKGEGVFQVNEEKIILKEGEGLFINSGYLHAAEERKQSDCTYICLNVSPQFMLSQELYTPYVYPYIKATNFPYMYFDLSEDWGINIQRAIIKIQQLIQQQTLFFEIDITMQLTTIWKNLIMNDLQLEYDQVELLKTQRMKQMLDWIHQHYTKKMKLEDIARSGQLSRSECCRYFKRILKTTPINYVTDFRIQKSLVLLGQAESNVTEVAYQVGFNSTSYFIDKFRKSMNMTPLVYKKYKKDGG